MPTLKDQFGQNLKTLRTSKGFTQEQFAELIDIDPRQLSRIETGRSFPSTITLEKICQILNVDIKELFNFNPNSEVYIKNTPENILYNEIRSFYNSPQKLKFIQLAIKAINNDKKAMLKMQSMIEGMLVLKEN